MVSVPAVPRVLGSWAPEEPLVSLEALLHVAASEPQAVAVEWLAVARQQAAVLADEPVWAVWAARGPARQAEAAPALAAVVPWRNRVEA